MARIQVLMGLAFLVMAFLWAGTMAQSNSSDCTNVIISLSPCLNYITGNSSTPAPACCSQLRTVVGSQPQCLCQVLNGGASNLGLNINQTQALALPRSCNVQTPPVSQCNAVSPSGTPSTPGSSTPNPPNSSGGGSKTVPTSGNDATSNKLTASLLFCILFVSSYLSNFNMA